MVWLVLPVLFDVPFRLVPYPRSLVPGERFHFIDEVRTPHLEQRANCMTTYVRVGQLLCDLAGELRAECISEQHDEALTSSLGPGVGGDTQNGTLKVGVFSQRLAIQEELANILATRPDPVLEAVPFRGATGVFPGWQVSLKRCRYGLLSLCQQRQYFLSGLVHLF